MKRAGSKRPGKAKTQSMWLLAGGGELFRDPSKQPGQQSQTPMPTVVPAGSTLVDGHVSGQVSHDAGVGTSLSDDADVTGLR